MSNRKINPFRGARIAWALVPVLLFFSRGLARADWKSGDALPDLTQYQLTGSLPDLKGKVVVVDFWASWCGPCGQSFPVMDDLQKKYRDRGLVIIAVNEDDNAEDMKDFLQKHAVTFAVVRDAHQKLVEAAGIPTMPSSFVVDREGHITHAHSGFHGDTTRQEYVQQIESLLH